MTNRALQTLYTFNGLFMFAGSLLGPLYAVFADRFTVGVFGISASWAMFMFSSTVFEFVIAKYGDRVMQKRTYLMLGMAIRSGAWFGFMFVDSLTMLLALQVVIGLGDALGSPVFEAIFAEHLDPGRHIREYSNWRIVANGVTVAGTLLGGWIVAALGFTPLFMIMSGLALAAFLGIRLQRQHEF